MMSFVISLSVSQSVSQSVRQPTPVVQSEWDIGDISQEIAGVDHDNILALAHTTDLTWVADYTLQINFSLKKTRLNAF